MLDFSVSRVLGAVDIGGSKIDVGIIRDGGIITRRACPTAPTEGPLDGLRRISELLRDCCLHSGLAIDGIGIGCTGPIDAPTGVIGSVDLLPGWQGFPLSEILAAEHGVSVAMENDADAAALGEYSYGKFRDCQHLVYVSVGTGIGAGVILSGKLYRGSGGAHPELGHQSLDASGPLCYCGAHGCWEILASGPALLQEARIQFEKTGTVQSVSSAREVCDLARAGSPEAQTAVSKVAFYLGLGLANVVTTLCPDRIVLGGGLMHAADLFLEKAHRVVQTHAGLVPVQRTTISIASLGADAALIGASEVWLSRYSGQTNIRTRTDRS